MDTSSSHPRLVCFSNDNKPALNVTLTTSVTLRIINLFCSILFFIEYSYQSAKGDVKNAVIAAIDAGYRHLDCAFIYQNEEEIGEALKEKIKDGTIERDDIYITTKVS